MISKGKFKEELKIYNYKYNLAKKRVIKITIKLEQSSLILKWISKK